MELCTTFRTTYNLRTVENLILKELGMTKKAFQKRALDDYIQGGHGIDPDFLIKDKSNPSFVVRRHKEQVYMTASQKKALEEIAKEHDTYYTNVVFQAINDYCLKRASLLPPELMVEIENSQQPVL